MASPSREPLDPALKARLLEEARTPWRGLRRALWFAFTASAGLGLATMAMRASVGDAVTGSDLAIQVGALALFGSLLWFDRAGVADGSGLG
jgi:Low psii accumulation1 / Rep27